MAARGFGGESSASSDDAEIAFAGHKMRRACVIAWTAASTPIDPGDTIQAGLRRVRDRFPPYQLYLQSTGQPGAYQAYERR
jgi:hypothetical protein